MTTGSIEDEVLGNLRRLPLGPEGKLEGTVADLGLPLEYLRRVADRVIQASFRERWRVVVGDGVEHSTPPAPPAGPLPDWISVMPERAPPSGSWSEQRPADRAFRAPILARPLSRAQSAFRAVAEGQGTGLRVQLTGPGFYAGPGDGGSLDILRQLVERCPLLKVFASVGKDYLKGVVAHVRGWSPAAGTRVVLIPEPLPVSQWARDNAIPLAPIVPSESRVHLLAPRWAGRGEEGGTFIPGESFLMDGLSAAGLHIHQSQLLFEGGNLMVIDDPKGGRRILLVGEAEVHRNIGMRRQEVLAAFCRELGADAAVMLPAASFHIDLELTVAGAKAFVVDTHAAVRAVCRLAAERLAREGLMRPDVARLCADPASPYPAVLGTLAEALRPHELGPGQYPLALAKVFQDGPVDSGVGNLQRILFAMDWLAAEIGHGLAADSHHGAYLRSLRRAEKDRAGIRRQLKQIGWQVVPVPAISAEVVSLNPINGVWLADQFLMSAYGGFFSPIDHAAAGVLTSEGVRVTKVSTGETQRRGGGLHCAVGAL